MRRFLLTLVLLPLALLWSGVGAQGVQSWSESFAGYVAGTAYQEPSGWMAQLHQRESQSWATGRPMAAQHGADCATAPPDTHPINGWDGAVFICAGHLMTAISATGYGLIALTPPAVADFRSGPATIRWRMSTERRDRDWITVEITPEAKLLSRPLLANNPTASQPNGSLIYPDLRGHEEQGVIIKMNEQAGNTVLTANRIANYVRTSIPGNGALYYENFLTPSPIRRDEFAVTISRTSLSVCMPEYVNAQGQPRCWINTTFPDLGFDVGAVQFVHHSYNPCKDVLDEFGNHVPPCPNTWHWDDFSISPALARIQTRVGPHLLAQSPATETADYAIPPSGGVLHWAGATSAPNQVPVMQVSHDSGVTWTQATLARGSRQITQYGDTALIASFLCPVPVGTTQVRFKFDGGSVQDVWLRDD